MGRPTESPGNGSKSFFNLQMRKKSRQASRSFSQDRDPQNGEFATAVLAATFAIHSLEEAKTPQNKNERIKEGNRNGLQPHSNEVTRRPSFNNNKNAGETSMRKPTVQDHEAQGRIYPGRTPSRSFSFGSTPDTREKVERHEKLKSVLAWANGQKMKAKHKTETIN